MIRVSTDFSGQIAGLKNVEWKFKKKEEVYQALMG
jgi:hypothetical protein